MTTFYFILGMVTVLVIAEVVAAFIVIKTINTLKEQARDCENQFNDVHRRIDGMHRDTDQQFQEVYRQLDSRLDKLENKLIPKQVIKG
jgi:phosphoglycerate-specific signal transduction histidine kinase